MADNNKVASMEGGLVTSSDDVPAVAANKKDEVPPEADSAKPDSKPTTATSAGSTANEADTDATLPDDEVYEMDENGEILLDEFGNPVRLPPPADPVPIFKKLTSSHPITVGKSLSRKERVAKGLTSTDLAYGEVTFDTMRNILGQLKELDLLKKKKGTFIDLGAGTGKAVLAAAMLHSFERCVGVEVLHSLHSASNELLETFKDKYADEFRHNPEIEFVLGDIAEFPWKTADIVFINMAAFTEPLVETIKEIASDMPKGACCVTITKQLHLKSFEVLHTSEQELNWGQSHVYVHVKAY